MRDIARRGFAIAGLLLVGVAHFGAPAAAQPTPLPGPAQPGQIQDRFRPGPSEPAIRTPPPVSAPRQPIPPGSEAVRFRLADVRVTGLTVYGPDQLRSLHGDLIGTDVSLADMINVANAMTARMREDGYILSQVVVPEQTIADGVIELQAVEGFVDEVVVEGDIQGPRRIIDEFTAKIRAAPTTAIGTPTSTIVSSGVECARSFGHRQARGLQDGIDVGEAAEAPAQPGRHPDRLEAGEPDEDAVTARRRVLSCRRWCCQRSPGRPSRRR